MASIRGGDKAATYLRNLQGKLTNASEVRVGWPTRSSYPDGTSVPMVAAINEYGAPSRGQPPRPYFRRMIAAKSPEWPKLLAFFLKKNEGHARQSLNDLGEKVGEQLKFSINELVSPPLKPSTIKRKGFAKPLIETKLMRDSIKHVVK